MKPPKLLNQTLNCVFNQSQEFSTKDASVVHFVQDQWITQILWITIRMFIASNATEETLTFGLDQWGQQTQI